MAMVSGRTSYVIEPIHLAMAGHTMSFAQVAYDVRRKWSLAGITMAVPDVDVVIGAGLKPAPRHLAPLGAYLARASA
jgi:hypothetical protein